MGKLRALVVEDDSKARSLLAKIIEEEGFDVSTAEDGKAGWEAFKKESPELVITDLKMPEIGGIDLIHKVREVSEHTQVIITTGYGDSDTAIEAVNRGVLDYLKKPIDLNELSIAVGRAKEKIAEITEIYSPSTVLLAEDDESTLTYLSRTLEKEKWVVHKVRDGEAAVETFKKTKIDLILLDINMPKKHGLEALEEMHAISDDFEAIVLTGYGDESNAIKAMRCGAMTFLKKPVDIEELILLAGKANEKLKLRRALKYRKRELELAKKTIVKITKDKQIIIDLHEELKEGYKDYAHKLINAITPIGIIVIDIHNKILFSNRFIAKELEAKGINEVNEKFVKALADIGIKKLNYDTLNSSIQKAFRLKEGTIETISVSKYSYISFVCVTILTPEVKEKVVIVSLRGERE